MPRLLALVTVAVLTLGACSLSEENAASPPPVPAGVGEEASPRVSASADAGPTAPPPAPGAPADGAAAPTTPSPATALLQPADHGDGDSWRDTAGREYRLGMVNAPELDECFGAEASAERKALTAAGFRAEVYSDDRYGRGVAVVTTADGTNLNVHLARHGFVDDRYLADFRHENPSLAAELDLAFAEAQAEGRGLWSACVTGSQSAPGPVVEPVPLVDAASAVTDACHPDYATCVPVRGDGSGQGDANDLDCGDVQGPVRLNAPGVDPYRFDADGDGTGCDA
jgi:endonuclease YncB( thermonuclease family)